MKKQHLFLLIFFALAPLLFAEETLLDLLGTEWIDSKNAPVESRSAKLTGIYFSAHWCSPCRGFTPALARTYNKAKRKGFDFEIIFVSCDKTEEAMMRYMEIADMPWPALPYSSGARTAVKNYNFSTLGNKSIPCLVILDANGEIITSNGRRGIESRNLDAIEEWLSIKEDRQRLPSPEKDKMNIHDLALHKSTLEGKVIKTKITGAMKISEPATAHCVYHKGKKTPSQQPVVFPEDGLEFFQTLSQRKPSQNTTKTIYVLVREGDLVAVGTRYKKHEYGW
jgi:thiol-disulfide isomerase/thioredoxin